MSTVAAAILVWAIASHLTDVDRAAAAGVIFAVFFSALSLAMSVALIRSAFHADSAMDLVFGVLFAVAFLLVRWFDVIGNMLLSGLLLFATGGGLLFLVQLWRGRRPADVEPVAGV